MDMTTEPVRLPNGDVATFTIRLCSTLFKCNKCNANVFFKPDKTNLSLYECNSCGQQYEAE